MFEVHCLFFLRCFPSTYGLLGTSGLGTGAADFAWEVVWPYNVFLLLNGLACVACSECRQLVLWILELLKASGFAGSSDYGGKQLRTYVSSGTH